MTVRAAQDMASFIAHTVYPGSSTELTAERKFFLTAKCDFQAKKMHAPLSPYDRHLQARYSTKAGRAKPVRPGNGHTTSLHVQFRILE